MATIVSPAAAAEAVNWIPSVAVRGYIGSRTIVQINALSPAEADSVVVTGATGTPTAGSSDLLAAGDLAEYDGTQWKQIVATSGGFPPSGTRALVHVEAVTLFSPLVDGTDEGKVAEWDGTSLTPDLEAADDGDNVSVSGDSSVRENRIYQYDGVPPSGLWVQTGGVGVDGGIPFTNLVTVDSTDPTADESDLQTAVLAATIGKLVYLSPETHDVAGQMDVAAGVTVMGMDPETTIARRTTALGVSWTMATDSKLQGIGLLRNGFDDGHEYILIDVAADGDEVWIEDCTFGDMDTVQYRSEAFISIMGSTGDPSLNVSRCRFKAQRCIDGFINLTHIGGDGRFRDCEFEQTGGAPIFENFNDIGLVEIWDSTFKSGTSVSSIAINVRQDASYRVHDCHFDGFQYAVQVTTGAVNLLEFYGCTFENFGTGWLNHSGGNTTIRMRSCNVDWTGAGLVGGVIEFDLDEASAADVTVTAATYTALGHERLLLLDRALGVDVALPPGAQHWGRVRVKDAGGTAGTVSGNHTITPDTGTIEGAAFLVIDTDFGEFDLLWDRDAADWKVTSRVPGGASASLQLLSEIFV